MSTLIQDFFKKSGKTKHIKQGHVLINAQDEPRGVYFIVDGYIKTYTISKYGEINLHLIRKKSDVLPIIWALNDKHREVYYEAMTDCDLLYVSRQTFNEFIQSTKEANKLVIEQIVSLYQMHADRVNNLQFRSAKERVAYFLIAMSQRFGQKNSEGLLIDAPLRHQDIADSINTARETTSRQLKKLVKKKIISYHDQAILILDMEALKSIVN